MPCAYKDVQELREFIDARLAQGIPKRRYPWIVIDFALLIPLLKLCFVEIFLNVVGISHHRAKLQYSKVLTVYAHRLSQARAKRIQFSQFL